MSGGSMNYLSLKVEDAAFYRDTPLRRAFAKHLHLVAEALHAIEWNDSGDGADNEDEAIRAALIPGEIIASALTEARDAVKFLQEEVDNATTQK